MLNNNINNLLKEKPINIDNVNKYYFKYKDQLKGIKNSSNNYISEYKNDQYFVNSLTSGYINYLSNLTILEIIKYLEPFMQKNINKYIIDFGGADGKFYDYLDFKKASYINIEPSLYSYSKNLKKRLENNNFFHFVTSCSKVPIISNSIDAVICNSSLDHVEDYKSSISEAYRILKKGCPFIVTLTNKRSWWKVLLKNTRIAKNREKQNNKEHYFIWSPSDAKNNIYPIFNNFFYKTFPHLPFNKYWQLFNIYFDPIFSKLFFNRFGGIFIFKSIK